MGFYFNQKDLVLDPCFSVLAYAGRPTRSTDVHRRARQFWQEGRPTDPVDRPDSSALWKGPGRPSGRPDRETCSLYPGSVDRPVDRWRKRSEI